MNSNQLSIIFTTYNQKLDDILLSLKSAIKQKDLDIEIIVCDDGSKIDYFREIEEFFIDHKFNNYKIIKNKVNLATVKNIETGLPYCNYKYVKLLSPGDYFVDDTSLSNWVEELDKSNKRWSFCSPIYYSRDSKGKMKSKLWLSAPMITKPYIKGNDELCIWNMIAEADIVNGASVICEKQLYIEYLSMMRDRIFLCEDIMYKILAYDGITPHYYDKYCIVYDKTSGASNKGVSEASLKKNGIDSDATMKIFEERLNKEDKFQCKLLAGYKINELNKHKSKFKRILELLSYMLKNRSLLKLTPVSNKYFK